MSWSCDDHMIKLKRRIRTIHQTSIVFFILSSLLGNQLIPLGTSIANSLIDAILTAPKYSKYTCTYTLNFTCATHTYVCTGTF